MTPVPVRQRQRGVALHPDAVDAEAGAITPTTQPTKSLDPALEWVERLALEVEYRSIASLHPSGRNARTHTKKQIEQIAASLQQFGFVNPILVGPDGEVVAGHGRLAAAERLGLKTVPVIGLQHLSEAQRRAYRIADNRLAELSGWDDKLLAIEFEALIELETTFEIEVTGFDMGVIDTVITAGQQPEPADPADAVEEPKGPAVTEPGDLWLLGPHRLLCADAREKASFETLMAGASAQMVFTDPPYNVPIDGHVSGLGKVKHREFVMASGEMSEAEFTLFLTTVLRNLASSSMDGAIHYVCMDWRHIREVLTAGAAAYTELKNLCVWMKDNAGMGSFYRAQHELVFAFKSGTAPHINNFKLGETGRHRSNVWRYAGVNTLKRGRDDELAMHPTVKPMALVIDAIKDCSKRQGIILDAFGGSGTTLIAAQKTGRRACLLELDPLYVDVTIRRWQQLFKEPARHAATGLTFEETAARRHDGSEVGHV
jgi:hypothetical protein